MSTTLRPVITDEGITALIDARNRGVSARITQVAVGNGNGPYTATKDMTALKNEIQRVVVAGGELFGSLQNQLHLTAVVQDDGDNVPDVYSIFEIGFFLETGELFAVYASPDEKLAEKVSSTDFVLAFDLVLTGVEAGGVVVDGTAQLGMPVARDNLLIGKNTVKIHTQAEFDAIFNQGDDTEIQENVTIALSPIQQLDPDGASADGGNTGGDGLVNGASGGVGDGAHNTYNGRPAYVLRNSLRINSNVSIIGFNQEDTIVAKGSADARINIVGTPQTPVTGIRFYGWSFDGRGGVGELGGNLVTNENGGGIHMEHARQCQLNCKIVNHKTELSGGAIFGGEGVSQITASNLQHNVASNGSGIFGCDDSEIRLVNCDAVECLNSTIYRNDGAAPTVLSHGGKLKTNDVSVNGEAVFNADASFENSTKFNAATFQSDVEFHGPAVFQKEVTFDTSRFTDQAVFDGSVTFGSVSTFNNGIQATSLDVSGNVDVGGTITTKGFLGVGTDSPVVALTLVATEGGVPVGITQGNFGGDATMELTTQDAGGNQASRICLRGNADNSDIEFLRGARNSEAVTVIIKSGTGFVGIGTASPTCPLHVEGAADISTPGYGFLNRGSPTGKVNNTGIRPYSISASNRVKAAEFNAMSDGRIKRVHGESNRENDLGVLLRLKIADYGYVDSYEYGNTTKKGLIAQQVETVFPQAVQQSQDFVPDIFAMSEKVEFAPNCAELTIELKQAVDLSVGDQVRFIDEKHGKIDKPVKSVSQDQRSFTVGEWDFREGLEKIFVYGKQVDDFRTIDYSRILMLCVSAVQSQQDRQRKMQQENSTLSTKVDRILREFGELRAEVDSLHAVLLSDSTEQ